MQILPSDPAAVALALPIAGHAMPYAVESAELFDIDMDDFTRMLPFISAHRLGRFESFHRVEAQPPQDPAYGGGRDIELTGDLLAGVALTPQNCDYVASGLGSLAWR